MTSEKIFAWILGFFKEHNKTTQRERFLCNLCRFWEIKRLKLDEINWLKTREELMIYS
jgi:hypothetical protein